MSEKLKCGQHLSEKDAKKVAVVGGSLLIGWALKKMSWFSVIPAAIGGVFVHQALKKSAGEKAEAPLPAPPAKAVKPASPAWVVKSPKKALGEMTRAELYEMATIRKISGRSKMNKGALVKALAKAE